MVNKRTFQKYICFLSVLFILNSSLACKDKKEQPGNTTKKEKPVEIYTVEIKAMKFVPDVITVDKGDKVVFINRDIVMHCVTEEKNAWTSSQIPSGEDYMVIAKQSVNYYCAIHKVMKGKIIVK
jgi:plastocyanin